MLSSKGKLVTTASGMLRILGTDHSGFSFEALLKISGKKRPFARVSIMGYQPGAVSDYYVKPGTVKGMADREVAKHQPGKPSSFSAM